jgi:hypothetical protein
MSVQYVVLRATGRRTIQVIKLRRLRIKEVRIVSTDNGNDSES